MNYDDAYNFIFNEIGEEADDLLWFIAEDNISEAIALIKKLTNCDELIAKALWTDLKNEYGTEENNPYIESLKNNSNQQTNISNLNTPRCPICQSTNLSKITTTSKAVKIAMFGVFGMGDNGKTWKCNNCSSKF